MRTMTKTEIEETRFSGIVVSHEPEEITWLDDEIEELHTVFGVSDGVFDTYGDAYDPVSGKTTEGGDLIVSVVYTQNSVWDIEKGE